MKALAEDEKYMMRCIELAKAGVGYTAPNPMVGAVVMHNKKIIGEGYHKKYGDSHAEVNAIHSVKNKILLKNSTLYVNLEPCSHFGKTPPCTDLIIKHNIPNVVIGTADPNPVVAGKGIEKLKTHNINVKTGILQNECLKLNKYYFLYHKKQRPYIILKWAQSKDGFIDIIRTPDTEIKPYWISNAVSKILVHKWRSEIQGILAGTNTIKNDNPKLNVREWKGKDPVRIIFDRNLSLTPYLSAEQAGLHVFDSSSSILIFNEKEDKINSNREYIKIDFDNNILQTVLSKLFEKEIMSIMVEGGKKILENFISQDLWDEIRLFKGNKIFSKGLPAPLVSLETNHEINIHTDKLYIYKNNGTTKKLK